MFAHLYCRQVHVTLMQVRVLMEHTCMCLQPGKEILSRNVLEDYDARVQIGFTYISWEIITLRVPRCVANSRRRVTPTCVPQLAEETRVRCLK